MHPRATLRNSANEILNENVYRFIDTLIFVLIKLTFENSLLTKKVVQTLLY